MTAYQDVPSAGIAPPPECPAHSDAVPLSGPRFETDPSELYREMRRDHGSVVPVLLPGDVPAWLVIGYQEMYQVTNDSALFPRDSGLWNQWDNAARRTGRCGR